MIKYILATVLLVAPTLSSASAVSDGCKNMAMAAQVFAQAKEQGLTYEDSLSVLASVDYLPIWSNLLAETLEFIYDDSYSLTPDQLGIVSYMACMRTLEP